MKFIHAITSEFHFFFNLPGSCQMEGIVDLYNYISNFLIAVLFFVSSVLAFVIYTHMDGRRHLNQLFVETKENFTTWSRFVWNWTHSTALELTWTIIPTFILIFVALPSFVLLYSLDEIVDCQGVVKITAGQWFWEYEYPVSFSSTSDILNVKVSSYMKPFDDLTPQAPLRLLETDMPLVLPHSVNVKLVITSKDVLHSFAVPALGIKMDAVPGRLNQVTVFITEPGVYYGQCSELCGVNHAYMPIEIHAVSMEAYEAYLKKILEEQECEQIEWAISILLNIPLYSELKIPKPEIPPVSDECLSCQGDSKWEILSLRDYIESATGQEVIDVEEETFQRLVMEWIDKQREDQNK